MRNLKKNGAYWTCSSHHKKGCKANVTTDDNKKQLSVLNTKHNHPPPDVNIANFEYIEF